MLAIDTLDAPSDATKATLTYLGRIFPLCAARHLNLRVHSVESRPAVSLGRPLGSRGSLVPILGLSIFVAGPRLHAAGVVRGVSRDLKQQAKQVGARSDRRLRWTTSGRWSLQEQPQGALEAVQASSLALSPSACEGRQQKVPLSDSLAFRDVAFSLSSLSIASLELYETCSASYRSRLLSRSSERPAAPLPAAATG